MARSPTPQATSSPDSSPTPAPVTHCLVGRAVRLELFVVGELDVDGLASQHGRHGGVIVHHGVGSLLCVHLDEGLAGQRHELGPDPWGLPGKEARTPEAGT